MSRCIALTRTDYHYFEPNGPQCHTYGINFYLPSTATFTDDPSPYKIRSVMTNGIMLDWDPFKPDFNVEKAQRIVEEFKEVRDLYWGDYYPLSSYSTQDNVWMAYQFAQPDHQRGIALAFRRGKSIEEKFYIRLEAIEIDAHYTLKITDEALETIIQENIGGKELLNGIELKIPTAPGSILLKYEKLEE
jgi:alpha-galactosidase